MSPVQTPGALRGAHGRLDRLGGRPYSRRVLQLATDKMQARVADGIGWVTFNHPERRNAVSLEMWQALGDIMEAFDADDGVRVVVLRGAGGKAFVSGADISEFEARRSNAAQRLDYGQVSGRGYGALRRCHKPVLAMIQGYCIGGGLVIALAADLRFATPDSRFGVPAAKLGIGYDYPHVTALARLVGPARAADILYSARQLPAEEALRCGLVEFVVPDADLETAVTDYATTVARNAPLTVAALKASLQAHARDTHRPDLDEVQALVQRCNDSEDHREGRRAFMEKRAPQFRGR